VHRHSVADVSHTSEAPLHNYINILAFNSSKSRTHYAPVQEFLLINPVLSVLVLFIAHVCQCLFLCYCVIPYILIIQHSILLVQEAEPTLYHQIPVYITRSIFYPQIPTYVTKSHVMSPDPTLYHQIPPYITRSHLISPDPTLYHQILPYAARSHIIITRSHCNLYHQIPPYNVASSHAHYITKSHHLMSLPPYITRSHLISPDPLLLCHLSGN